MTQMVPRENTAGSRIVGSSTNASNPAISATSHHFRGARTGYRAAKHSARRSRGCSAHPSSGLRLPAGLGVPHRHHRRRRRRQPRLRHRRTPYSSAHHLRHPPSTPSTTPATSHRHDQRATPRIIPPTRLCLVHPARRMGTLRDDPTRSRRARVPAVAGRGLRRRTAPSPARYSVRAPSPTPDRQGPWCARRC